MGGWLSRLLCHWSAPDLHAELAMLRKKHQTVAAPFLPAQLDVAADESLLYTAQACVSSTIKASPSSWFG